MFDKKNRRLQFALLLFLVGIGALSFQNCGAMKSGQSQMLSVDSVPETSGFKVGEPFDFARLPIKSQMVEVMHSELSYNGSSKSKAIALNAMGLGFVSVNKASAAEAERTALESCYIVGGNLPCGLVALGDKFAVDQSELESSFQFSLDQETSINPRIPFILDSRRATLPADYNAAASPKALAVSADGTFTWLTQAPTLTVGSATHQITLERVQQYVLSRCEMLTSLSPCFLYAANNNVVFNSANVNRRPVIDYLKSDMTNSTDQILPGVTPGYYLSSLLPNYIPKISATTFGSIYMSDDHRSIYRLSTVSQTDADQQAKAACETYGKNCFRYAAGLKLQDLEPHLRSNSLPKIKCLATVRQDCAAHKLMGCEGADFYVIKSGLPTLEKCN